MESSFPCKRLREWEPSETLSRSIRPCLNSWTSIAKAAEAPLKRLIENGLITQSERIELLKKLIPATKDGQLPSDAESVWSTTFLEDLIQRVAPLAASCGLTGQLRNLNNSSDLSPAAENLGTVYTKCVAKILKNPSPSSLNILLKDAANEHVLQKLQQFISERPLLLEDPDVHDAAKQFIMNQWDTHLKTLRPLSKLWHELRAGKDLLSQIAPDELSDPFYVTFLDQVEMELGDPELDVLAEASDVFRAMFEGNLREATHHKAALDMTKQEFQLLGNHLLRGEPLSYDTCATLLVLADKYLISDLASKCLEWLKQWMKQAKNQDDRIKILAQIGLVETTLRARLGPMNEAVWTTIRDKKISKYFSHTANARVCDRMITQIVKSQDMITWPTSLKLVCHTLPSLSRLTALEHLELEHDFRSTPNVASEIGRLRLKTLTVCNLSLGQTDEEVFLEELRSLKIKFTLSACYNEFCVPVGRLNSLEELTLDMPGYVYRFPDISKMKSLHTLRIISPTLLSQCRALFTDSHATLLEAYHVQFSQSSGRFILCVDRAKKSMQVKYLSGNWNASEDSEEHIRQLTLAFPYIEEITFMKMFEVNAAPYVWKKTSFRNIEARP